MSWMPLQTATKIGDELRAAGARDVRIEIHPEDSTSAPSARARVTLTLRDASTGNIVVREAEDSSVAADMLTDARAELMGRSKATHRRIRAEKAPT